MSVSERERHDLYEWARTAMGDDRADILMRFLPPVGWGDVATRKDLEHHRMVTRQDLDVLGAELRTEMAELRTDLRTEMAELRTDLRTEMAELRTDMADGFRRQTSMLVGAVAGVGALVVALNGLFVALA